MTHTHAPAHFCIPPADAHNVDTFGGSGNVAAVAPALTKKEEETSAGGSSAGAGAGAAAAPLPAFFQGGEGKVAPTAGKEQEQDEWARQQVTDWLID